MELQDRKPVRMLRVIFCYLYFDHQGRLDRDKVMKDGALMVEAGIGSIAPTKSGSVIHARPDPIDELTVAEAKEYCRYAFRERKNVEGFWDTM